MIYVYLSFGCLHSLEQIEIMQCLSFLDVGNSCVLIGQLLEEGGGILFSKGGVYTIYGFSR